MISMPHGLCTWRLMDALRTITRPLLFASATLLLAITITRFIRINMSPSVPIGFYMLHAVPPTLTVGELVLVPVPEPFFPFAHWWIPLLKPVAGLPGALLTIVEDRFYIDGKDFGPVLSVSQGRPVPRMTTPRLVQPGEVCVAVKVPRAIDCRYMAPTPVSQIQAVATPLWTWGAP